MLDANFPLPTKPLHQSREYAQALDLVAADTTTLADGTLVVRRTLAKMPVAMLPRAQIPQNFLKDSINAAGLQRTVLAITPDHPAPWLANLGAVAVMSPVHVATLDLMGDMRARMHQKWRNRLRFAERQNLRITRQNLPSKPNNWLLLQDQRQQGARGYSAWSEALTLAYAKANRGSAKLFTAFDGKTPVAAMLFLRHGDSATYHVGHATDEGRACSAHNLLLWEGMNWLASKGVTSLELGQVNTDRTPGLARFKLGAGATLRPLGGTWIWWPPLGRTLSPLKLLDQKLMRAS
ncbi:GNAT family N-acetyltransferase [Shimia sp.]|uniref:GNAT family N-acetyltransferase n=1 Tax=Shimia sp. TaxID=1954381 RepID=UPI003B8CD07D